MLTCRNENFYLFFFFNLAKKDFGEIFYKQQAQLIVLPSTVINTKAQTSCIERFYKNSTEQLHFTIFQVCHAK